MEAYKYNIQTPGDQTVFVIYSMKQLRRDEQNKIFEDFRRGVTHAPSRFSKEIIMFDDRPPSIRQ